MNPEKRPPKSSAHHLATEHIELYVASRVHLALMQYDVCGCQICEKNAQEHVDWWWLPKTRSPYED